MMRHFPWWPRTLDALLQRGRGRGDTAAIDALGTQSREPSPRLAVSHLKAVLYTELLRRGCLVPEGKEGLSLRYEGRRGVCLTQPCAPVSVSTKASL